MFQFALTERVQSKHPSQSKKNVLTCTESSLRVHQWNNMLKLMFTGCIILISVLFWKPTTACCTERVRWFTVCLVSLSAWGVAGHVNNSEVQFTSLYIVKLCWLNSLQIHVKRTGNQLLVFISRPFRISFRNSYRYLILGLGHSVWHCDSVKLLWQHCESATGKNCCDSSASEATSTVKVLVGHMMLWEHHWPVLWEYWRVPIQSMCF